MFYITSGSKDVYDKHIVAFNREWSARFQYYYNGTWSTLTTTNFKSFQLSDYSTDGSNISMGTVIGGKLSVNLMKISKTITSRLTRGTLIKIQLILNSSASTSSITMTSGVFVIDESKLTLRQGGSYDISLTAYDFTYKLTGKYVASSSSMSAVEILGEIGNKNGFTIGDSVTEMISEFEDASGVELNTTGVLGGAYLGSTGEWMDDEGETYSKNTGLVEVKQGYSYEYYGKGYSVLSSVLWYDENKAFIGAEEYSTPSIGLIRVTITPPTNAKYAIFQSFNTTSDVTLSVTVTGNVTKYTPLVDLTYKQTIGYMAGCYGCFAYIDNDLQLQFGWYEANGDTINANRIYNGNSFIAEMEERTIVMLETGTSDNPIVVPNNANGFSINFENPYITQAQAQAVYDKKIADGQLTFRIGKLSYKGSPLNSPGTIVTVKDIQNQGSSFFIMKRTTRYDGGLGETIESQGESETTINYKLASPTQQRIDRALSRMEEAIKKATDVITQTKGSVFELIPIDENDPTKGNSGWKLYSTEIGSNNLILANSSGIGFSSNGGQSFNAMAMYIDENGIGHINANCIDVGKLSANVIDTSTLVVSKGNVDGLDTELADLLKAAEDAESKANTAQNTANNASSTASSALSTANTAKSTANTASTNASSALSVANSANGKIANWASANDTTLINGAKIYTGSITAKQIAAESITADKLSVGVGTKLNQFYNDEFYDGDRGWYSYGGTLSPKNKETAYAYMHFVPNSSGLSAVMQKVWLVNGQRYALAAQIFPMDWGRNGSSNLVGYFIGSANTGVGQDLTGAYNYNGETVIKHVFDYTGETGFVDLGISFVGFLTSSYTACNINIAWMSFSDATGETPGFYCTRKEWLASGYKDSNYLGGSVNNNTSADAYSTQKALTIDASGNLVTLGTIKSNNGEIGSLVYNRERMDITTHSYYEYGSTPFFVTSRTSFVNPPEYSKISSLSGLNSAEHNATWGTYIEVATDAKTGSASSKEYAMITSAGVSVASYSTNGSVDHSALTAYGVEVDGVLVTSREASKKKISEKSKVLSAFKSSKIYEYKMKYDDEKARAKTGFVIERETPEEVLSDDGKHINLYSMASMNWKATQELLERLEAIEKAVKNNA